MMSQTFAWLVYAAFCAGVSYGSLLITIGYLRSYALATPNHRSGHTQPTPQGAGLAVIPVAVVGAAISLWLSGGQAPIGTPAAWAVGFGALALMLVGFADDARGIGIGARLGVQTAAVGAVLLALPPEFRIGPSFVPMVAERMIVFLLLMWFINVANFMDGMDWMSVIATLAMTLGTAALAAFGYVDAALGWCAAGLMGAIVGFMPFNAHPAKVFLGDAGSLPLGLLLGLLLLNVAAQAPAAALILPLYYLADATITLLSRMIRGERFWEAHREHFYQRALRNGWPVHRVLARLGLLHACLITLAFYGGGNRDGGTQLIAIGVAAVLVGGVLWKFSETSRCTPTSQP